MQNGKVDCLQTDTTLHAAYLLQYPRTRSFCLLAFLTVDASGQQHRHYDI